MIITSFYIIEYFFLNEGKIYLITNLQNFYSEFIHFHNQFLHTLPWNLTLYNVSLF